MSPMSDISQQQFAMNLGSSLVAEQILMDDIVETMSATPMGPSPLVNTDEMNFDELGIEGGASYVDDDDDYDVMDDVNQFVTPNGDVLNDDDTEEANTESDNVGTPMDLPNGLLADDEFVIQENQENEALDDDLTNEGTHENEDDVDIVQSINTLK